MPELSTTSIKNYINEERGRKLVFLSCSPIRFSLSLSLFGKKETNDSSTSATLINTHGSFILCFPFLSGFKKRRRKEEEEEEEEEEEADARYSAVSNIY